MARASRRRFIQRGAALAGATIAAGVPGGTRDASAQGQGAGSRLSKTQQLRALLRKPGVVMAPEGYTVISARLAEAHGFEVITPQTVVARGVEFLNYRMARDLA